MFHNVEGEMILSNERGLKVVVNFPGLDIFSAQKWSTEMSQLFI